MLAGLEIAGSNYGVQFSGYKKVPVQICTFSAVGTLPAGSVSAANREAALKPLTSNFLRRQTQELR